jgi:hypothetical protein
MGGGMAGAESVMGMGGEAWGRVLSALPHCTRHANQGQIFNNLDKLRENPNPTSALFKRSAWQKAY